MVVDSQEVDTDTHWLTYTSNSIGYTVSYPEGWRKIEKTVADVSDETRFSRRGDTYLSVERFVQADQVANLFRRQPERLEGSLIEECHAKVLETLSGRLSGFTEVETGPVTIGLHSTEAHGTTFEFRMRRGFAVRNMRGMVVTMWNGDRPITLRYACPARDEANMSEVFQEFLRSFISGAPGNR